VIMDDEKYLVWSHEHGAWWRPESHGYTVYLQSAGRYSRDEALMICGRGRDGWPRKAAPPEIPVREADAIACAELAPRE
jgi:hypothetical protein